MTDRYVVVDTADGYVFRSDHTGVPFNGATAIRFALQRNSEQKPEYRTYEVFKLVPVETGGCLLCRRIGHPLTHPCLP